MDGFQTDPRRRHSVEEGASTTATTTMQICSPKWLSIFVILNLLLSCFGLSDASEVDDILARAAIAKRILESGRLTGSANPGYDIYLGQRDVEARGAPSSHGYDIYLGQRSLASDSPEGLESKEKRRPLYLGKRASHWNSIPKRDAEEVDDVRIKEDKRAPLYLGKRDGDRERRFLFLGKRRPLYLGKRDSDEADFAPNDKLKDFDLD